jgi:hypothetical protein
LMDGRGSFLIPTALVIAGVGIPLVLLSPIAGERPPPGHAPLAGPTGSPSPAVSPIATAEPFVPPTYREGGNEVMPVVFPDGTSAELVYPAELDLARRLGVAPNTQARLLHGDCGDDLYITRERLAVGVSGSEPVAMYEGVDRPVELWKGDRAHGGYRLVFSFGGWYVAASCREGPGAGGEEHQLWASSLQGHETRDGYLILETTPPLEVHPYRDAGGPALFLYDSDIIVELVAGSENEAEELDPRDGVVQWRFQKGHIRVYANAFSKEGKDFLATLIEGLSVRKVVPSG